MQNVKISHLVWILTPFVFSFAFGLDIYVPIIPKMAAIFDTTPALVQLTMSLFLFTTGVGQLFIGPLADQFGRRPLFYFSSFLYALGSLGCVFAPTIDIFLLSRVVSSLGACGMLVTSFALVRDLYSGPASARIYGLLNGAIGISPTFAPILGGYLAVYFGWQSVFAFLAGIGFFGLFITQYFIRETIETRTPMNKEIVHRYLTILKNRQFLTYSLLAGLAQSVFFCFFSVSPFIIIDLHGVPTQDFGYYFAIFGSVIALAGLASGPLVTKVGMKRTIWLGISLMFLGGGAMVVSCLEGINTLASFLVPMAIACTGAMFLVGSSAAGALEPFGEIAGTASAAFGTIEFGLPAIAGSLLMLFPIDTTIPYGVSILLIALLASLIFWREGVRALTRI